MGDSYSSIFQEKEVLKKVVCSPAVLISV